MQPTDKRTKSGYEPPPPSELGALKFQSKVDRFIEAINYLDEHSSWVRGHQEQAREYCDLLLDTKLLNAKPEVRDQVKKVQRSLFNKYPHLFNAVIFRIGDVEKQIPLARLTSKSEKFKAMLVGKYEEGITKTIDLMALDGMNENTLRSFVEHLDGKEVEITGDNVYDLFVMAQEHLVPTLEVSCVNYIIENIDLESFNSILDAAIADELINLKWACLIFVTQNARKPFVSSLGKGQSEKFKRIVDMGLLCFEYGLNPILTEDGLRAIELDYQKPGFFNNAYAWTMSIFTQLQKDFPISGIIVSGTGVNDTFLESLATIIKRPLLVSIHHAPMTKIPHNWLLSADKLKCTGCDHLASVNAQDVRILELNRNQSLKSVEALATAEAHVLMNPALEVLNAPNAKEVLCGDSSKLSRVNAQNARVIISVGCPELHELRAPNAYKIDCLGCTSLKVLHAPMATEIDCRNTPLEKILVPENCEINGLPEKCDVSWL